MDAVIIKDMECRRNGVAVLSGLSLSVTDGTCLHLRGANGSGKTTLLRAIAGFLPLFAETITLPRHECLYIGTDMPLTDHLSARANLSFWAQIGGAGNSAIDKSMRQWDVAHIADIPVARLSSGQRQRVNLCRLSLSSHKIWLLDEVMNALDADGCAVLHRIIEKHCKSGGIVMIASHIAPSKMTGVKMATLDLSASQKTGRRRA